MNNKTLTADPFFRTAYNDLSQVKGFNELLSNHTYVLIKPDGLVGGSVNYIWLYYVSNAPMASFQTLLIVSMTSCTW